MNAIKKYDSQPEYINDFSSALLDGFYLRQGETFNDAIARAANAYSYGDNALAQRIYEYAWKGWFMFASPILSNAPIGHWKENPTRSMDWSKKYYWEGEKPLSMPISCFALEIPDTIIGQTEANQELAILSVAGGGVGLHNSIRETTEVAPGPIPYMKTMDAMIGYYKQGKTRRGTCAYYMDVNHPSIIEHIKFRIPSGGDSARKADNRVQFHNAVNITDEFIDAVFSDSEIDLVCPAKGKKGTMRAREIWEEILDARALTGEPYILKIDECNRMMPEIQKARGLKVKGSNICIEVTLPTNKDRTFVCCLSSLNLEKWDEWKETPIVQDLVQYLDNVLEYFIQNAPDELQKAKYSAERERAIGIGTMGWHYYLQSKGIPFEGGGFGSAIQETHKIFSKIKAEAVEASLRLGKERGESPDMVGTGRRNSCLLALAPNSNNSVIIGTSPSIEPVSGNCYVHTTRAGAHVVKNPHLAKILSKIAEEKSEEWLAEQWKKIEQDNGSVQKLDCLTEGQKKVFKTFVEIDQHWVVEQADHRQQYVCQSQSLNVAFPAGCDAAYFNSVHLKALASPFLKALYYARMERGINADVAKEIERKALENWKGEDCVACSG